MKFDRNQVIGYLLLAILLFVYLFYNSKQQAAHEKEQRELQNSQASAIARQALQEERTKIKAEPANSPKIKEYALSFDTIETSLFTAILCNRGANLYAFYLKKYHCSNPKEQGRPVALVHPERWAFNYPLHWSQGLKEVKDLYFAPPKIERQGQEIKVIYAIEDENKRELQHIYTFREGDYRVDFRIQQNDRGQAFFDANTLNASWLNVLSQQEKNLNYERSKTEFSVFDKHGDFDYFNLGGGIDEKPKYPIQWVSMRQQFFNTTLISKAVSGLSDLHLNGQPGAPDSDIVTSGEVSFQVALNADKSVDFAWFLGPNDYQTLASYDLELERLVDLGQGVGAFAKYINKAIVMPLFVFLHGFIGNLGLVILCLTILIRLITSPLLYSSYKSSAKMKILNPEIEVLKKEYGGDEQTLNLKRMELFRDAGVNPLQGCLPALLQLPIFFALFYFFSSNIGLREQSFWWASDLSSYDSIYDFGFKIPLYGDHISLFTLLNVVTSFVTAFMNRNTSMDQSNPMMKYMPYIMPVIFLGFFNDLPSALTWYYTVSNTITIILQIIIQKFIINHDKLLAQIEENRKKPKKKSIWLQKAEEMQSARKSQNSKK